ncbi:MAG: sulfite exporter TauE/SafE family protein [Sandaracinaceae bacterium]|nr:sulfite exporter TauE/SafE family protein [Sandaracinaceae bacterium]
MSATLIAIGAGAALGLASIPHCIGMCGPIAGACSGSVRSGVGYQLARIAAYSSLGALAAFALLPVREALSGGATAWIFALITAFALLLSAYRIGRLGRQNGENTTQSSALIPAASLKRPKGQTQNRPGLALPVGLGLITGLLPCGALYGAFAVAATAGDPMAGALGMASFAVASSPGLIFSQGILRLLAHRRATFGRAVLVGALVLGAIFVILRPLRAGHGAGHDAADCHTQMPQGQALLLADAAENRAISRHPTRTEGGLDERG